MLRYPVRLNVYVKLLDAFVIVRGNRFAAAGHNGHLLRAIYLMNASVVSKNGFFKAYFSREKGRGLAVGTVEGTPQSDLSF